MMKKRKDECLFCSSRTCSTRIYRREIPIYDEIACGKHVSDLEKHSDEVLGTKNGIMRTHVQTTGKFKRGEIYSWEIEAFKKVV
jgi:hypothetical protein